MLLCLQENSSIPTRYCLKIIPVLLRRFLVFTTKTQRQQLVVLFSFLLSMFPFLFPFSLFVFSLDNSKELRFWCKNKYKPTLITNCSLEDDKIVSQLSVCGQRNEVGSIYRWPEKSVIVVLFWRFYFGCLCWENYSLSLLQC